MVVYITERSYLLILYIQAREHNGQLGHLRDKWRYIYLLKCNRHLNDTHTFNGPFPGLPG